MQIETEEKFLLDAKKGQRDFMDKFNAASYAQQRLFADKIREYSKLVTKTEDVIKALKKRLELLEKSE